MKCAVSVHTYLSHLENVIHYVFLQKLIMVFVEVNSQMMGGGGGVFNKHRPNHINTHLEKAVMIFLNFLPASPPLH